MKKTFLYIALFILFLFPLVSAFESPVYSIDVEVGTNEINVNIGQGIDVNITETCTTGQTTCVGTNYYVCVSNHWVNQGEVDGYCGYNAGGTLGGGGTDYTGNILGFLETETNNFSNVSDTESISLNDDKGPEESTNSAPITGGVISGVGNFVKSGAGALTLSVLVLVGAAVVTVLLRKKLAKKSSQSSQRSEETETEFESESE